MWFKGNRVNTRVREKKYPNYHLKCAFNSGVCAVNIRFILIFFYLSLRISPGFPTFLVIFLFIWQFFSICCVNSSMNSSCFCTRFISIEREKDLSTERERGWCCLQFAAVDAIQMIPWIPFGLIIIVLRFIFFICLFSLFMSFSESARVQQLREHTSVFRGTNTRRERTIAKKSCDWKRCTN